MYLYVFFLFFSLFNLTLSLHIKRKSNFLLPTDTDGYLKEPLKTQFRCVRTGYFADIDNNCQMYHVCVVQQKATGHAVTRQYSFVCSNGTMFNQLTMTCDDPEESLPCEDAPKFYSLNKKIGEKSTPLHSGEDWDDGINENNDFDHYIRSESYNYPSYHREYTPETENQESSDSPPIRSHSDLSADRPGIYYYSRRKVPYDI